MVFGVRVSLRWFLMRWLVDDHLSHLRREVGRTIILLHGGKLHLLLVEIYKQHNIDDY